MSDLDKRIEESKAELRQERLDNLKVNADLITDGTQSEVIVTVEVAGAGTILERYDAFEVVMRPAYDKTKTYQTVGTHDECFAYLQGLRAMLDLLASMSGGYEGGN